MTPVVRSATTLEDNRVEDGAAHEDFVYWTRMSKGSLAPRDDRKTTRRSPAAAVSERRNVGPDADDISNLRHWSHTKPRRWRWSASIHPSRPWLRCAPICLSFCYFGSALLWWCMDCGHAKGRIVTHGSGVAWLSAVRWGRILRPA